MGTGAAPVAVVRVLMMSFVLWSSLGCEFELVSLIKAVPDDAHGELRRCTKRASQKAS